jgi:membrane fusion protein, multidrug efflux system
MTYKVNNMKRIITIAMAALVVLIIASCGSSSKEKKSGLGDKKVELEKLKKEKSELDAKIRVLEEDIAKLDTNAVKTQRLVSVAPVTVQDFTHYIELQGKVDAENVAYVSPRGQGGVIKAIYVTEGQAVRKGQTIMKLDDAIARQQLVEAQQSVAGVESQAKLARSVYERRQNLWKQNIGSEVQVLQAKTEAEAAESQLNAIRAKVSQAQEAVNQSNVFAEINGTIDQVNAKVGEFFSPQSAANPQAGIRIVNTSNLKISIPVPENYITKVKAGTPLLVELPELNRSVTTKVTMVSKLIDPTSRSFTAEGKLPADNDFRPNQIATAKIEDYKSKGAITVPINVVQTDEKGKYVYVAETTGGKTVARKKSVNVGEAYGGFMEIKAGLKANDVIITEGYQNVYDGQAITTGIAGK